MQMDRILHLRIIDEAHDTLRAAGYDEGWAGGDPIVAN